MQRFFCALLVMVPVAAQANSDNHGTGSADFGPGKHHYYVSRTAAGSPQGDDTNPGTEAAPLRLFSAALSKAHTHAPADMVFLHFDRGDQWDFDSVVTDTVKFTIAATAPKIVFTTYGTGEDPVFFGGVNDFASVPETHSIDPESDFQHYVRFMDLKRDGIDFHNLHFDGWYANILVLYSSNGNRFLHCTFSNFGGNAIVSRYQNGTEDNELAYCLIHHGQEMYHHGKRTGWGAAINFEASGFGEDSMCRNNHMHHNVVYDIYGEGLNGSNSIIEYNVVGNTGSVALNCAAHDYDQLTSIIRYNLVVGDQTSDYWHCPGGGGAAIRAFDEDAGGNNNSAHIQIYGNVIINRRMGVRLYCNHGCADVSEGAQLQNIFGRLDIYNNTVIDCTHGNFVLNGPAINNAAGVEVGTADDLVQVGHFYNNVSVLYDRTTAGQTRLISDNYVGALSRWTIDRNLFWDAQAGPGSQPAVEDSWGGGKIQVDPAFPGEPTFSWTGQAGEGYVYSFDVVALLTPPAGGVVDTEGRALGADFAESFLTEGTLFSDLPDTVSMKLQQQPAVWALGAVIRARTPPPQDGGVSDGGISDNGMADSTLVDGGKVDRGTNVVDASGGHTDSGHRGASSSGCRCGVARGEKAAGRAAPGVLLCLFALFFRGRLRAPRRR